MFLLLIICVTQKYVCNYTLLYLFNLHIYMYVYLLIYICAQGYINKNTVGVNWTVYEKTGSGTAGGAGGSASPVTDSSKCTLYTLEYTID